MKKAIYILFLSISLIFFLSDKSMAQEYYPTTGENKHWIVIYYEIWGLGNVETIYDYYMNGDTVIQNMEYKKVYQRELVVTEDLQPPFTAATNYQLGGLVRDQEEERKVYAIRYVENGWFSKCPLDEEYLMYDFSVQIGDAVDFCTMEPSLTTINHIEETTFLGEETRMFNPMDNQPYFEGIGNERGLFELMSIYVKDEVYPPYLAYYCPSGDCDVLLGNDELIKANYVKVSPNPASDFVQFKLGENEDSKIQIYNLKGQLLEEFRGASNFQWNCKNIIPGVYFYKAISGNTFNSDKIIIQ